MSGSVRPPRTQPAPPPPEPSVPGKKHKPARQGMKEAQKNPIFDPGQIASATECTGILAAPAQSEEEADSISSLEGIHAIRPTPESAGKNR